MHSSYFMLQNNLNQCVWGGHIQAMHTNRVSPYISTKFGMISNADLCCNCQCVHDRIDCDHNKSVIRKIVKEIGCSKFTARQIESKAAHFGCSLLMLCMYFSLDGVKIYRKSLRGSRNERSEDVQRKIRVRSRQQRVRAMQGCSVWPKN